MPAFKYDFFASSAVRISMQVEGKWDGQVRTCVTFGMGGESGKLYFQKPSVFNDKSKHLYNAS